MNIETLIAKVILDVVWYEIIWLCVKKGYVRLQMLKSLMKILMYLNTAFFITGGDVHVFVNLYFMTMWYFVIYPDRILNELTEEQAKAT